MEAVPGELAEDMATGALRLVVRKAARKQHQEQGEDAADTAVRRGVIRFLVLIVDCSEKMNERDMRPHRLGVTMQVVKTFIDNFFDQNPISQLAIIELRDGTADKITELSGNARHHKSKLEDVFDNGGTWVQACPRCAPGWSSRCRCWRCRHPMGRARFS